MSRMRSLFSLGLMGLAISCGVEDPSASGGEDSVSAGDKLATAPGLKAVFGVSSSWGDGYNGLITITNTTSSPISDWELRFKLNGTASISGAPWGAGGSATKAADGTWTVLPNTWGGNNVPANGSVTVSYGGMGTFSGVSPCSINGYDCSGAAPPGDTTPPTVSLSASPTSLTSAGNVILSATASDNVGVTRVEFYRNGSLVSTDTTSSVTSI